MDQSYMWSPLSLSVLHVVVDYLMKFQQHTIVKEALQKASIRSHSPPVYSSDIP